MASFFDTNFLVRYLTGGPPDQAAQASIVIETQEPLQVTDSILAETAHVLASVYRIPREAIVDHLVRVVYRENIVVFGLDKVLVVQALRLSRPSARVSFPDAMLWAVARSSNRGVVYTFDRRFPSDGIELRPT